MPPSCRPLTPDPRLTTQETSLGYFPFSAAQLFSSRPLAECRRVRQGERYPGVFRSGGACSRGGPRRGLRGTARPAAGLNKYAAEQTCRQLGPILPLLFVLWLREGNEEKAEGL
ncbi:hypothetical protein NQZ68_029003 [Dissostichus eleginoides]|nr:hypothetical protein NQZ68_029003 [Dissostichus eleginoides]